MDDTVFPVEVISAFSTNGDILPLRLRIENEEHQLIRMDIEEVIRSKQIQHIGTEACVFLCRASVHGKQKLFELKYILRSHNWYLQNSID